jgi:hypothetical protein
VFPQRRRAPKIEMPAKNKGKGSQIASSSPPTLATEFDKLAAYLQKGWETESAMP